jgi:toxin ParE1/3/4
MTGSVALHRKAEHDLARSAAYLRKDSPTSAFRFLRAARTTMEKLAAMPGVGALYESDEPELAGVRWFPVSRFRNHLIFYRPTAEGIVVLRVLHGARDIGRILSAEG